MAEHPLVIGIDIGGTNTQAGVVDARGTILHRLGAKTMADRGPEGVCRRLKQIIDELLVEASLTLDDIAAIGVGAPGAIDYEKGVVLNAPNLRWVNFPLIGRLGDMIPGKPVAIDNDVNVAVLGENVHGAGRNAPAALGIWVGTGIGGGIILDHKLYRGPLGSAGEIGQTTLFPDNQEDKSRMEHHCSRKAVERAVAIAVESGEESAAADFVYGDVDAITPKEIATAYTDKDPVARRVVDRAADLLGVSIANAVGVLSVPLVLFGGGLTEALGQPYVDRIAASFRKRLFPIELADRVEFRVTELRDNAGLMGAAILAQQEAGAGT